jgi:hypothetical protein
MCAMTDCGLAWRFLPPMHTLAQQGCHEESCAKPCSCPAVGLMFSAAIAEAEYPDDCLGLRPIAIVHADVGIPMG